MRYRALGAAGHSVSAVTLALPTGDLTTAAAYRLICAGLEQGVNSFEIADADAAAAQAVGQAAASVGRRLLVLSLRVSPSPGEDVVARTRTALRDSGGGSAPFDMVILDATSVGARSAETAETLRREGLARLVGVSGEGDAVDQAMGRGGLDLIATAYNLSSGWPERNRIKAAASQGLSVIGRDFEIRPARLGRTMVARGLSRLFHRGSPPPASTAYAFLDATPGWSREQICLAYALTEPALATVQVAATAAAGASLCEAAERQLPAGVAAQIEMARFATPHSGAA